MIRLTDAEMQSFVRNGYIKFRPDYPPELHEAIRRKTDEMLEKWGNPRNNLLPRIPEIQQVFDHPRVHGALSSILGDDYYLHLHRHVHSNMPGSKGQGMHKDSLNNSRFAVDDNRRHHHTPLGDGVLLSAGHPRRNGTDRRDAAVAVSEHARAV